MAFVVAGAFAVAAFLAFAVVFRALDAFEVAAFLAFVAVFRAPDAFTAAVLPAFAAVFAAVFAVAAAGVVAATSVMAVMAVAGVVGAASVVAVAAGAGVVGAASLAVVAVMALSPSAFATAFTVNALPFMILVVPGRASGTCPLAGLWDVLKTGATVMGSGGARICGRAWTPAEAQTAWALRATGQGLEWPQHGHRPSRPMLCSAASSRAVMITGLSGRNKGMAGRQGTSLSKMDIAGMMALCGGGIRPAYPAASAANHRPAGS